MEGDERVILRDEFKRLARACGWRQAEISRRLEYEPATINGIMKDRAFPSRRLVSLFRTILAEEMPELMATDSRYPEAPAEEIVMPDCSDVREAAGMLRDLAGEDEPAFQAVKTIIVDYHRRLKPKAPKVGPVPVQRNPAIHRDMVGPEKIAAKEKLIDVETMRKLGEYVKRNFPEGKTPP